MGLENPQPFKDVINVIMKSTAKCSYIQSRLTHIEDDHLENPKYLAEWDSKISHYTEEMTRKLQKNLTIKNSVWWDPTDCNQQALHFARLLVSICSNSLKHCHDKPVYTKMAYTPKSSRLKITQSNVCKNTSEIKLDGTRTVIFFLIEQLDGNKDNIQYELKDGIFIISCEIIAPFLSVKKIT